MKEIKPCPLCNTECEVYSLSILNQLFTVDCSLCGKYNITDVTIRVLGKRKDSLYIISGVTRNFYELHKGADGFFVIKSEMIEDDSKFQAEFLSKSPKSVLEKVLLLLQYISRKTNYPGDDVFINLSQDYSVCFCKNSSELNFYLKHLKEIGDIKMGIAANGGHNTSLTAEGWRKVESLRKPNIESKQAFVAMWFDESMNEIFEKGICPLGDEKDESYTGFKMLRIDQEPFNDKICDHIIAEIRQSRFMIADCTELRPAVFFEAGYAMGLGIAVIFTCKEGTDIKKCFDTDHYNHILWKDADDLKNKLKDRILATIGKVRS
jgi:hypothetical protein